MTFRTVVFWTHLVAGVVAGVVVLIMSVTGVLLTYEKQMVAWAERGPAAAAPAPDAVRLPIDSLLARARGARRGAAPSAITIRADRDEPVSVAFGRDGTVLLNAYTGDAIGPGAVGLRGFFRVVTDWHRWLGASGERRSVGKAVTGASNLAFLLLIVSGAYLWLPRLWTRAQLRAITWFRGGLRGRARDFNWHNTFGIWSVVPLFAVVLSATVISYPWASNLAYRVMGERPPAPSRPSAPGTPSGRQVPREPPRANAPGGLEAPLAVASRQVSGWRSISLRVPADDRAPLAFSIDAGTGGQPQKRGTLTVERNSGAIVAWEPFSANSPGRRLRTILRFAHTGEVLGLTGQTIAGVASAGGACLVYTGLALSLRRLLAWRRRRTADAREAPAA